MKLIAAQIACPARLGADNLERHVSVTEHAARLHAAALYFPELSLTGYSPSLARQHARHLDDPRLAIFQHASDRHQMLIAIGVPTWHGNAVQISLVVFQPGQSRVGYAKQWLHADETAFFAPGERNRVFDVQGHRLAPAICYESLQAEHAQGMADAGAQAYLASVAKSARGVLAAQQHYPHLARLHAMPVLMANAVGPAEGFLCAGGSAAWSAEGALLCQAGSDEEALVVYDLVSGQAEVVAFG